MRLIDITESLNTDTALMKLGIAMKEIQNFDLTRIEQLKSNLKDIQSGYMPERNNSIPIGKWFQDNFLNTKGGTGHNLQTLLMQLSKEPGLNKEAKNVLDSIKIYGAGEFTPGARATRIAPAEQFDTLETGLIALVDKIPKSNFVNNGKARQTYDTVQRLKQVKQRKDQLEQQVADGIAKLKADDLAGNNTRTSTDPAIAARKEKDKAQKQMGGAQRSQADQVVNQVLASLPDQKIAGKIRQEISKQDNKLQALAVAMKKYGLTEGMRRLHEAYRAIFTRK